MSPPPPLISHLRGGGSIFFGAPVPSPSNFGRSLHQTATGYQTPQSVHRPRYCDLAIKNTLWGRKIGENVGRSSRILTHNLLDVTFWVTKYGAKFHSSSSKLIENWGRKRGHRQTYIFLPCDAMRCTVFVILILSVRPSVWHTRRLCPHGSTYDHDFFTIW